MKKYATLVPLILLFACANLAAADQKSARPTVFNRDTAMLAIYGEYNQQHKGTLIPVRYTSSWDMKNAGVLATAIVAATYTENAAQKGVIAIQRQKIFDGEVVDSHAAEAEISVYIFAYNGKEWVFEKGQQRVTKAGAHGSAPDGRLIRIGRDQYGLLFEGGDIHQGITNDYAFIISLGEAVPAVVIDLETGGSGDVNLFGSNEGQSDKGWEWEAKIEFVENGPNDYFVLKLTSKGTEEGNDDKIRRVDRTDYFVYVDDKYRLSTDKKYAAWKTVDSKVIYGAGQSEEREPTMPTIPRKRLRH